MTKTFHVSKIKIPSRFMHSIPGENKIAMRRAAYSLYSMSKNVVVNQDGYLIDGYASLLVLLENGVSKINCTVTDYPVNKRDGMAITAIPELVALLRGKVRIENLNLRGFAKGSSVQSDWSPLVHLVKEQNNKCYICGREMGKIDRFSCVLEKDAPTIDHIMPKALGGSDSIDNMAASCYRCNQLKGQLMFSEELRQVIVKQRNLEEQLTQIRT